MKNSKNIRSTYKSAYSKISAPEELKNKIERIPQTRRMQISIAAKISLIAAAVVLCFVLSNLVTWAATGSPWIYTVSDSMYTNELNKIKERHPLPESVMESTLENKNTGVDESADLESADLSGLDFDNLSPDEKEMADRYFESWAEGNERSIRKEALNAGYVYQFEKIEEYNEEWGVPLHGYRFVKAFSSEELDGAQFNDDYTWINIQGEDYFIMRNYIGDFRELDQNLPELEEWTSVLRVFSKENYENWPKIMADESTEYMKKFLAQPIYEGKVALYSNEDRSLIRTFTEDECHNAEISENFQVVRIAGELYMVTYIPEENGIDTKEIRLYPPEGYGGDAKTGGIDQLQFYTMADFNIEE